MPDTSDILVVGGGVMGLWGALKAAEAGLSVTLADAGAIGQGASGGLLGALFPWMPDRWVDKKQYQFDALVALPGEIARLEALTGLTANFRRLGRVIPLPGAHLRDIALRHQRDAETNWRAGEKQFHWHLRDGAPEGIALAADSCRDGHVVDTLAARIEPRALVRLLRAALEAQPGVRIVEHARLMALDAAQGRAEISGAPHPPAGTLSPLGRGEGRWSADSATDAFSPQAGRRSRQGDEGQPQSQTITFSHALVAAGTQSFPILETLLPPLAKPLGLGVKGQAALLRADLDPASPVVFLDGLYIVPQEGGLAAVGSTSENSYDDPFATDARLDDIISRARALMPALRDAEVVERWAGIRPKAIGRDPLVGPVPGHSNVIALTGGFKISFGMAHRLALSALDHVLGTAAAPLPQNFTLAGQLEKELDIIL